MHDFRITNRTTIRTFLDVAWYGFLTLMMLATLIVIVNGFVAWRVASRIEFDSDAGSLEDAVQYAVVATLQEGDRQQKLQTTQELAKVGPDARPFADELMLAASDGDPPVSAAAIDALRVIQPSALDQLEETASPTPSRSAPPELE